MHPLLDLIRRHATAQAAAMGARAAARGLRFTLPDGSARDIPLSATPVIVSRFEMRRRQRLTALLASAGVKAAGALLRGPLGPAVRASFSPAERAVLDANGPDIGALAIARVDFFVAGQAAMALELNTTIPAMSGYSDIAALTLVETLARLAQLGDAERGALVAQNGSNAAALHEALLRGYADQREGRRPSRIALLCRRLDAQLTELEYCAARFRELGSEAEIVYPDEVSLTDDAIEARGLRFDLVFRHLFVRRLDERPAPAVLELFSRRGPAVLLNPPSAQGEAKVSFALLSEAGQDLARAAELGLTDDELSAVREAVPWTRRFVGGATTSPSGESLDDLVAFVSDAPERFVLKRSWEYGGKAVFIGAERGEPGFEERVAAAYGEPLAWSVLCRRAAADPRGGGFVVQERIALARETHLLCTAEGAMEAQLYVDFSAYASVGLDAQPSWGGVCRGSAAQIVNIVGGGGVVPVLLEPVADALAEALSRIRS